MKHGRRVIHLALLVFTALGLGAGRVAASPSSFLAPLSSASLLSSSPRFTVTVLGSLAGGNTFAGPPGARSALNVVGQVIGDADVAPDVFHAFLWEQGTMRDLGALGGDDSIAYSVNASGQVVGSANIPSGDIHAFLWERGAMMDLGTLAAHAHASQATLINAAGQAVGWSETDQKDATGFVIVQPFFWEHGAMAAMGSLGGNSPAMSIASPSAGHQLTRPTVGKALAAAMRAG